MKAYKDPLQKNKSRNPGGDLATWQMTSQDDKPYGFFMLSELLTSFFLAGNKNVFFFVFIPLDLEKFRRLGWNLFVFVEKNPGG